MDKTESLERYNQGRDAWNEWAMEVWERRNDSGQWAEEATANFAGHEFAEDADFQGFIFPGEAAFYGSEFKDCVKFEGVKFKGLADFTMAKFIDAALFHQVSFEDNVRFVMATFESSGSFRWSTFKCRTSFRNVSFKSNTSFFGVEFHSHSDFSHAKFRANAEFIAIRANSAFAMIETNFTDVPDFEQSNFMQAPRLDDIGINDPRKHLPIMSRVKAFFRGNQEQEVRWRALRRLAVQGHDHLGAQRFFREELAARRGVTDKYWQAPFWFGLFYQCFSDFGRSFILPIVWWLVGLLGSMAVYRCLGRDAELCDTLSAALGLSLHRGLAALSGLGDKLPDWYACLYGVHDESARPIIPDEVSFFGFAQTVFSAVMIFLFLLALRNRFRLR